MCNVIALCLSKRCQKKQSGSTSARGTGAQAQKWAFTWLSPREEAHSAEARSVAAHSQLFIAHSSYLMDVAFENTRNVGEKLNRKTEQTGSSMRRPV